MTPDQIAAYRSIAEKFREIADLRESCGMQLDSDIAASYRSVAANYDAVADQG